MNPQRANMNTSQNAAGATPVSMNKAVSKAGKNSSQNSLQINEIRDGVVIMNDGSFRSVLMLKSINFDLMSAQEREGVEYAYQGFLNSLYFPIQIHHVPVKMIIFQLKSIFSHSNNHQFPIKIHHCPFISHHFPIEIQYFFIKIYQIPTRNY